MEEFVYEYDGGVRLAGGPPGRLFSPSNPESVRRIATALPPPYQLFE